MFPLLSMLAPAANKVIDTLGNIMKGAINGAANQANTKDTLPTPAIIQKNIYF